MKNLAMICRLYIKNCLFEHMTDEIFRCLVKTATENKRQPNASRKLLFAVAHFFKFTVVPANMGHVNFLGRFVVRRLGQSTCMKSLYVYSLLKYQK